MNKRTSVFWAVTLAELALAAYALTSFAWVQPESGSGPDATLASAVQSPSVQR